ncbi:MAG TPA: ABC transporter substrate-binding protein [Stellaceae bacterium]|nr:ABC transporter substrate-binding protein [Stellaceae bacterium]
MRLMTALAATFIAATAVVPALAATTITVHYPMPGFFKDPMDKISAEFEKQNPDVKVVFASPSPTYEDGLQLILRQAGTPELPDVSFIGLNRLRVLEEKNVAIDLNPLIAKDGKMAEEGFSDYLLSLARFNGKQIGLAFATSNPIVYYNADLVRKAGGDPDHFPTNWDDALKLSAKIQDLGNDTIGMHYRWQGDDWMFSALLFGYGGKMLTDDEKKVAFNGPEGRAALQLLLRMVKDGKMPVLTTDAGNQAFMAGKLGMVYYTTGALRSFINGVGTKFDMRTAPMPVIDPVKGRLPTGGNAAVILTHDPDRGAAAFRFIKFASGPYGASVVVPGTGYVPNNELAAKDPQYLGDFYQKNPLFQAGLNQMTLMIPWYAFPGSNGVKVTQSMVDNLARVVEQKATPDEALADMSSEVSRLLPR